MESITNYVSRFAGVNKYINIFRQCLEDGLNEISILEKLDLYFSKQDITSHDFEEDNGAALANFYLWFMELYGKNEDILRKLLEKNTLVSLDAGLYFCDRQTIKEMDDMFMSIEKSQQARAERLADYILKMIGEKHICCKNMDTEAFHLDIPEDVESAEYEYFFCVLRGSIAKFIKSNGVLTVGVSKHNEEAVRELYAFGFKNGYIENLDKDYIIQELLVNEGLGDYAFVKELKIEW